MTKKELQARIRELENEVARVTNLYEDEIAQLICQNDDLEEKVSDLKKQIQTLNQTRAEEAYLDGMDTVLLDYHFPPYDFMEYQKEMVRKAVEHIRCYDSLRGLGV